MTAFGFNVLHINSSPVHKGSITRELSARVVARILERRPDAAVTVRDVGLDPPVTYLKKILRFIGISDVSAIVAEGVNISFEQRAEAPDRAIGETDRLFAGADDRPGGDHPALTQLSSTGATT